MNAPHQFPDPSPSREGTIIAMLDSVWNGHKPSRFDWQVLAFRRRGVTHLMQFGRQRYDLDGVCRRADFEANWYNAVAYAVRDTDGTVVHVGPVLNALGEAKHEDWLDAIPAEFLPIERRAAA